VASLVRCRECESRLLQLERAWLLADGRRVAERRCPECGRRDSVTAAPEAIDAWLRREQRLLGQLAAAAGAEPTVPV
jgi:hypothetical protein